LKSIDIVEEETQLIISLKFVLGSKSKLYLSLFNSNFWQNDGAHPLSQHRTVTWCTERSHVYLRVTFSLF